MGLFNKDKKRYSGEESTEAILRLFRSEMAQMKDDIIKEIKEIKDVIGSDTDISVVENPTIISNIATLDNRVNNMQIQIGMVKDFTNYIDYKLSIKLEGFEEDDKFFVFFTNDDPQSITADSAHIITALEGSHVSLVYGTLAEEGYKINIKTESLEWEESMIELTPGELIVIDIEIPANDIVIDIKKSNLEIAPDGELDWWKYELDEENGYITLTKFIFKTTIYKNVIVYPVYEINGKQYKTKIRNDGKAAKTISSSYYENALFYISSTSFRKYLLSIEFKPGIDYSEFIDASFMFYGCQYLQSIIFPDDFDTSNVAAMSGMFQAVGNQDSLNGIKKLDLTTFDTHNVTNVWSMFKSATYLEEVLVSRDKWKEISDSTIFSMAGCKSLTYIEDLETA